MSPLMKDSAVVIRRSACWRVLGMSIGRMPRLDHTASEEITPDIESVVENTQNINVFF